jgi:GntR family transcriptional regulator / MocR family aminotransferase
MIPVIAQSDKKLYEQIYEFYREAILQKRLRHHDKLPPHRVLAKELGIGNNTVIRAYEQLIHEGYVVNEKRMGLYVAALNTRDWQVYTFAPQPQILATRKSVKTKADFKLFDHTVDEQNFPIRQWRKCMNWALDHFKFQYDESDLEDPLKEQLIQYLYYARGVVATGERIIIGSGTNALLFWLAFVLKQTHSRILFEDPCYHRPRDLFSGMGYDVQGLAVGTDGIDVDKLEKTKSGLLYITPSHQYPTGVAIPVGNRIRILQWANKNKAFIIEDDFDCEFRYKTKLMPSLQALDKFDSVIYVGTFSNAIMPSLRVAYMVLPKGFPVDYLGYNYLTNTVPYIIRKTLAHFMDDGYWDRHLRKMRKLYGEKYEVCIDALKKLPAGRIQFNDSSSGLNILLGVNSRLKEASLVKRALHNGIVIRPASTFYNSGQQMPRKPEILFEFGSLPLQDIGKVVQKLYKAWFG